MAVVKFWQAKNACRADRGDRMVRVTVAMSGGVDSAAAAALLQEQGFAVSGATMRLYCPGGREPDDLKDAAQIAARLGIPHFLFEFEDTFRAEVLLPFRDGYVRGETPNPCVLCNRRLKFGRFLARALLLGADRIATGHYARVTYDGDSGRYRLWKAADWGKDQSYVLYSLSQWELSHVMFPLGGLHKEEARALVAARGLGLPVAHKKDSQDICFVPDGDYAGFLEREMGVVSPPGKFIDTAGRVLGEHRGLVRYTVGQRRGLGQGFGRPLYVLRKDLQHNAVVLGEERELYQSRLTAGAVNWVSGRPPDGPITVSAKTRYSQKEAAATVQALPDGRAQVYFESPQRAVTAGQAVVFYDGDEVLGGGTILREEPVR